jgi:hypothetical protein
MNPRSPSRNLPAELAEEQDKERKAVLDSMSGAEAIDVIGRQLKEAGLDNLPKTIWLNKLQKKHVEAAMHMTFSSLGGVPGMIFWASKNPTNFYQAYMKLAPNDSLLAGIGNVFINTAVPESTLDFTELDVNGRVKENGE